MPTVIAHLMTCGRFTLLTKFCVIATDHSRFSTQCHQPMGTKTTSPADTTHSKGRDFRPGAWHSCGAQNREFCFEWQLLALHRFTP